MKKGFWNKTLALVLTASMAGAYLPADVQAAGKTANEPFAAFTFDDEESGFTSAGGTAEVKGSYRLDDHADNGKALYLDGNASNYLSLKNQAGKSILSGKNEITISYDEKPDRKETNWAFYAAPNNDKPVNQKEHYIGAFHNNGNVKVERYDNENGRPACPDVTIGTDWAHIDIVFQESQTVLYVDGVKRSVVASDYQVKDIVEDGGIFYIGRANWGNGEGYKGWIDNFTIYDQALTDAELVSEEAAKKAVAADQEKLTLPGTVTEDFTLPSVGENYSNITWKVEDNKAAVIGDDGYSVKVTRPSGEDAVVVFTASIEMAGQKAEKEIPVTVSKLMDQGDFLEAAKEKLTIVNVDDVRGNIYLPETVEIEGSGRNASVTWKSSDDKIVTDQEKDGKPAGVVSRQKKDTKVILTATLTADGKSVEKEFELNVKKAHKQEEMKDYLFAYFVNNGGPAEQQIFFASSHDGDNWMDLNKKEAVLSVADSVRTEEDINKTQNQAGVRDPYMIRSPEGDKFYLIATDLCIGANDIANGTVDWGTSQFNGSHCLRIWESTDLVNWSEPWLAEVAPEGTTCAWAPEAIYDEATGEFVVYWASMTGSVQKVYASKTRDFRNFSEPELFIDNGNDHIIDTTIVRDSDGNYYRGSAAGGTIQLEKCTDQKSWLTDQSSWSKQGNIKDITGFTAGLEGPELFAYNQDDWKEVDGEKVETYGLLADNFGGVGYVPFYTTDIANAKWIKTADNDFNFDTNHKRHGTVIALTEAEYNAVMEAYGPSKVEVKKAPDETVYETGAKKLNPSGLVLTVSYANGKTEDVAYQAGSKNERHFKFSKVDFSEVGKQTVTVTYGEQKTSFEIEVKEAEEVERKTLAKFDFNEDGSGFESENAKATGQAYELKDSWSKDAGKALYLNGNNNNFLKVTDKEGKSLLTGMKELTISYEMKPDRSATNWVMYAAPNNNQTSYNSEVYLGIMELNGSTKVERYKNQGSRPLCPETVTGSDWYHVDVVLTAYETILYVNGVKMQTVESNYALPSILGNNSILQIGKANWTNSGEYFKGWIDNFQIENKALTEKEVKEISKDFVATLPMVKSVTTGTAPTREEALEYRGTDDHTAVFTKVDAKSKTITPYIRNEADFTKTPVTFAFNGDAEIQVDGKTVENGSTFDLSKDQKVTFVRNKEKEEWMIKKAIPSNNPVLPGQYADPDLDYFDGKFWLFPTTDGYPGWSGTKFHAFSSDNMVDWKDEGIIMELKNDNPGVNEQGVQIAVSPWAKGGSAWAPTIEEKDGKYYFYYCGKFENGQSAIGVAVADNPAGPYTDKGEALMTVDMCRAAGVSMGQAIDPSIFTDEDGTSYLLFGNGSAAIAQLNDDMMSIKEGTLKQIKGLTDFRESVIVTKKDGKYHWTWSCDDANSPNYHVNYGVSDTLTNADGSASVKLVKKNLLARDDSMGILGSAHQSVLHVKDGNDQDRYFMAYHRFYTPINIFTSGDGLGVHRETCIDEITFDEDGYMQIKPTNEGVAPVEMTPDEPEVILNEITVKAPDKIEYKQGEDLDLTGMEVTAHYSDGKEEVLPEGSYTVSGYDAQQVGEQTITVTYGDQTATFVVTVTEKSDPVDPEVTLDKITVKAPDKIEYKQGEDLDLTGMEVTAHYSDGKEEVLPEGSYTVAGYDANKVGKQTITVIYKDQTATFDVTVKEASKPVEPGKPDGGNQGQKPGTPDGKPAGQDQKPNKVPKTGDAADMTVYVFGMMAALVAGGWMLKSRRKEQE